MLVHAPELKIPISSERTNSVKPPLVREGESLDGLFRNKVRVIQAARGYRVSEDALILTGFVRPGPDERILDAGTGCGVIAFGLAVREPSVSVAGAAISFSTFHPFAAFMAERALFRTGISLAATSANAQQSTLLIIPDSLCTFVQPWGEGAIFPLTVQE